MYQLATETGLRASELFSLTWASFDLRADPPTVTIRADYSKHRRDDVLPVRGSTVAMAARWCDQLDSVDSEPNYSLRCVHATRQRRC